MSLSKSLKTAAVATAAGLVTAPVAVAALPTGATSPTTPAATPVSARAAAPVRHTHRSDTHPLHGKFHCGHLVLKVVDGTETETQDGDLRHGIAHVSISRTWRHVELAGSDGRTYRAAGATVAWFVLHAPDFETPVSGLEVVQAVFRGGPRKSPGWLREKIVWRNSKEADVVSGPCDF